MGPDCALSRSAGRWYHRPLPPASPTPCPWSSGPCLFRQSLAVLAPSTSPLLPHSGLEWVPDGLCRPWSPDWGQSECPPRGYSRRRRPWTPPVPGAFFQPFPLLISSPFLPFSFVSSFFFPFSISSSSLPRFASTTFLTAFRCCLSFGSVLHSFILFNCNLKSRHSFVYTRFSVSHFPGIKPIMKLSNIVAGATLLASSVLADVDPIVIKVWSL